MIMKNMFLFLAIASILIASPLTGSVFADKDDEKKKDDRKNDNKQGKDDKNDNNPFKQLQAQIDSFFDIFTELRNTDADLQNQIDQLDVSGQSCNVGDVVTGIGSDGQIICAADQQGGLGDIQGKIDVKTLEITDLENQLSPLQSSLDSAQSDLDAILGSPQYLSCNQQCAANEQLLKAQLQQCSAQAVQNQQDPAIICASQQTAVDNFSCSCNQSFGVDSLNQQISDLQTQISPLESDLNTCNFELQVLETLQNQFG